MLRITLHIERLLLMHDCVILPKVGGFVLQSQAASFTKNPDLYLPSRKELVFNQALKHNDGLLTESYMRTYMVNYSQATAMQEKDTEELKSQLAQGTIVSLGNMGDLQIEQGILSFKGNDTNLFSVESYGLSPVNLPSLKSLQQALFVDEIQQAERSADFIYLPINKRFLRTSAVAAAVVALFLLIPSAANNTERNVYQASFSPAELVSNAFLDIPKVAFVEKIELPVEAIEVMSAPVEVVPAVSKKKYHLIVASFPSKGAAEVFYAESDKSCYPNFGIIESKTKTRVYVMKFENKPEAEKALKELRKKKEYQDAWLFASR